MLRSVKSLEGSAIGATDGAVGKVKDFYFDDQAWVVRYLIVDTRRATSVTMATPTTGADPVFGATVIIQARS